MVNFNEHALKITIMKLFKNIILLIIFCVELNRLAIKN